MKSNVDLCAADRERKSLELRVEVSYASAMACYQRVTPAENLYAGYQGYQPDIISIINGYQEKLDQI